jgi:hypothetical protein
VTQQFCASVYAEDYARELSKVTVPDSRAYRRSKALQTRLCRYPTDQRLGRPDEIYPTTSLELYYDTRRNPCVGLRSTETHVGIKRRHVVAFEHAPIHSVNDPRVEPSANCHGK